MFYIDNKKEFILAKLKNFSNQYEITIKYITIYIHRKQTSQTKTKNIYNNKKLFIS